LKGLTLRRVPEKKQKVTTSHWNDVSPLTQGLHCHAACDGNSQLWGLGLAVYIYSLGLVVLDSISVSAFLVLRDITKLSGLQMPYLTVTNSDLGMLMI